MIGTGGLLLALWKRWLAIAAFIAVALLAWGLYGELSDSWCHPDFVRNAGMRYVVLCGSAVTLGLVLPVIGFVLGTKRVAAVGQLPIASCQLPISERAAEQWRKE